MKNQRQNGFTLIEIMVVVAIIGILASLAVPNLLHAISKSRQQACAVNRKNIDGAKLQWALDNHEPPEAMPTETQLYGGTTYIDHRPECPAHGDYTLHSVGEKCTCSILNHTN